MTSHEAVASSPDRAALVRAFAGDIVLCSWARHLTLTVPLSTQVYKMGTGEFNNIIILIYYLYSAIYNKKDQ